jgi:hypothetical protein
MMRGEFPLSARVFVAGAALPCTHGYFFCRPKFSPEVGVAFWLDKTGPVSSGLLG